MLTHSGTMIDVREGVRGRDFHSLDDAGISVGS
jgi:hypothetical protein